MEQSVATDDQPAATPKLSSDAKRALQLSAGLWLLAAGVYIAMRLATFAFLPIDSAGTTFHLLLITAWQQPRIAGGTEMIASWPFTSLPGQIVITFECICSLAWTVSCWLLADAERPELRLTGILLRVLSSIALLVGVAWNVMSMRLIQYWHLGFEVTDKLDPAVAFVVALHLYRLRRWIDDEHFAWVARKLPWVVAATGMLWLVQLASDIQVAGPLDAAIRLVKLAYSAGIVFAMTRLWFATGRSLTAEPVTPGAE